MSGERGREESTTTFVVNDVVLLPVSLPVSTLVVVAGSIVGVFAFVLTTTTTAAESTASVVVVLLLLSIVEVVEVVFGIQMDLVEERLRESMVAMDFGRFNGVMDSGVVVGVVEMEDNVVVVVVSLLGSMASSDE